MQTEPLAHRRQFLNRVLQGCVAGSLVPSFTSLLADEKKATSRGIPAVPGKLSVKLRKRTAKAPAKPINETAEWNASETAIIICDMWADHPCKLAAQRVDRMAPKMNRVISEARDHGVAIIHAPSGGIELYEDTPFRARIKRAALLKPPVPIQSWCYLNPEKEPPLPVDDSIKRSTESSIRGCDDPEANYKKNTDRHQHPAIKIIGYDVISANGQEIYNFLEQEQRKNIVIMGVHTNMCVLGRPFGIRQMRYLKKNVVLCRDLTDALYDPRDRPYVSHTRGTEMIIEHIEEHWCPSILGRDLTRVIPGSNNPDS
ncbi:MAG: isochorismatase family protein [Planctomycetes bacterium]|nr:isochorismatase family protein [Planctomycetota bacterium]MCH9724906.1 isochorismatase family protein [Planctomycetota bacterium]MCH9776865.1 isochorismatase family protein [Planctomycetota bacterium]MCH9792236.1 isochorismatase family protein [Planctomycetota bacterium]MDF1744024.1 isochorismatase family protein [Gimesia sp.]